MTNPTNNQPQLEMKKPKGLLILASLLLTVSAQADSVRMEPGKWEMTITTEMSMFPQP